MRRKIKPDWHGQCRRHVEIRGRTTQAKGTARAKMLMWDRLLCLRNNKEAKVMMEEDRPGGKYHKDTPDRVS